MICWAFSQLFNLGLEVPTVLLSLLPGSNYFWFLVVSGIVFKMDVNRVVYYYCSKQLLQMSVPCQLNFKSFWTRNRCNFRTEPCAENGILYFQDNMILCHRAFRLLLNTCCADEAENLCINLEHQIISSCQRRKMTHNAIYRFIVCFPANKCCAKPSRSLCEHKEIESEGRVGPVQSIVL